MYSPQHPIWAMAFRPFYLLAALYGSAAILLWGFGYAGTATLPAHYWHAHEMIWGYTGAVIVGFLLTASATWTGETPVRGKMLMLLAALWLLARIGVFFPDAIVLSAFSGSLFYWAAAAGMAKMVWRPRNRRNYPAAAALFLFGLSHALFHCALHPLNAAALHQILMVGLAFAAGFIGLIGNRVIPFFTAKRLNTPQTETPSWLANSALILPPASVMLSPISPTAAGLCCMSAGLFGLIQSLRWFRRGILKENMLWTLHLGFFCCSLGLTALGIGYFSGSPNGITRLGIHLIAVGGIGLLTIGMMARTALGHTGRPLYPAPRAIGTAFALMAAATAFRALAALTATTNAAAYRHSLRLSAALFALSLLLYVWRYFPWLTNRRNDGKSG